MFNLRKLIVGAIDAFGARTMSTSLTDIESPAGRFPLAYRLSAWHARFRYTATGRRLRALRKSGAWNGLIAVCAALPVALCQEAVALTPNAWTTVAEAAGAAGLLMMVLDLLLAWLADPEWIKLHAAAALWAPLFGIACFAVARHGLAPKSLGAMAGRLVEMLVLFGTEMWLLIAGLDIAGTLLARRQAAKPIFDPFAGRYCGELTREE